MSTFIHQAVIVKKTAIFLAKTLSLNAAYKYFMAAVKHKYNKLSILTNTEKAKDGGQRWLFCILFVFLLALLCFGVATKFSANKDGESIQNVILRVHM